MEVDFGEGRMEGKWISIGGGGRMREGRDGGGGGTWERVCQYGYGDHLRRECVQHRLNQATDEWSICAVFERQLNCKWGQGQKRNH